LQFEDLFPGTTLDTSKWNTMEGKSQNGVTNHASNITVSGGVCTMTLASSSSGAMMATGPVDLIGTTHYALPIGGFTEARILFPGTGTNNVLYNWPAWWTVGPTNWSNCGEIDIAEVVNKLTDNYWGIGGQTGARDITGIYSDTYHVFGMHRKATTADIWVDGVLRDTWTTNDTGVDHSLVLNMGNGWANNVYTGAGAQLKISYVRAWT
jgi:hypothetical protein